MVLNAILFIFQFSVLSNDSLYCLVGVSWISHLHNVAITKDIFLISLSDCIIGPNWFIEFLTATKNTTLHLTFLPNMAPIGAIFFQRKIKI